MYEYVLGCIGLFSDTFNAMWDVPIFRFFLLVQLMAVVLALFFYLSHAARK